MWLKGWVVGDGRKRLCWVGSEGGKHDQCGRIRPVECVLRERGVNVRGGLLLMLSLLQRNAGFGFVKGRVWKVVPIGADFGGGGVDDDEGRVYAEGEGDLVGICSVEFLHARIGDDEREREPALGVDVVVEMGVVWEVGRREVEFNLADYEKDMHD